MPDELEIEMEILKMEREWALREDGHTCGGVGASAELVPAVLAERLHAHRLLGWSRSLERHRLPFNQWSEWQEW